MSSNQYGFDFLKSSHQSTDNTSIQTKEQLQYISGGGNIINSSSATSNNIATSYEKSQYEKQYDVIQFLKQHRSAGCLPPSIIYEETGVDLTETDQEVASLLRSKDNIKVEEIPDPENPSLTILTYGYQSKYNNVRNKTGLMGQINRSKNGIRRKDLEDCYDGIDEDIGDMITSGDLIAVYNTDGIFCNGAERCIGGKCTPPVTSEPCNDGDWTTIDTCNEVTDQCEISQCDGVQLEVILTTDNYPSETYWSLRNKCTGLVEQSVSSGFYQNSNTQYSNSYCVPQADYDFVINDTYGDGICCSYGSGSYTVKYDNTVVASGGTFASTETKTFGSCTGQSSPTQSPTKQPTSAPTATPTKSPTPAPTEPTATPTSAPTSSPTAFDQCSLISNGGKCKKESGCSWNGVRCVSDGGSGPAPGPTPEPPTTQPPVDSPSPGSCDVAGTSCAPGTNVNCCQGCSGGKPANRVCL